ncbi:MAG: T9SS type A sorting domain-containing protein [Bacteroidetes bacterium]|nr:T9SS type A sorting domain-containing protein [Bacteroidota bacterium]
MRQFIFISLISILSATIGYCQLPSFAWVNNGGDASIMKIKTTSAGDYIAVGIFAGTVDFDPGSGSSTYSSNSGSLDIFIKKISASGNLLWVRIIGGSGDDYAGDIFIDASGKIYITGGFYGTVDFDPGTGTSNLTSTNGSSDIFMLRLSVAGNFSIVKKFGGNGDAHGENISADATGNIFISGSFSNDTISFGTTTISGIGYNCFIAKLTDTGVPSWAYTIPVYTAYDMVLDNNSNVYMTGGFFGGNIDFDPGVGTYFLGAGIGEAAYILKLSSNGTFVWANKYMVYGYNDEGKTLGLLSSGEVILGMDFQPNMLTTEEGYVIAKINPSTGVSIWWNEINNPVAYPTATVKDMVIDAADNIHYTGSYSGGFYAAGAWNSFVQADIFLGGYTSAGSPTVGFTIGYTDFNDCSALTIDASGGIVLCGVFSATLDFNFSPFAVNSLTPVGTEDNFILKLQQSTTNLINTVQENQNKLLAFPNPFENQFVLVTKDCATNSTIEIQDIAGRIIYHTPKNVSLNMLEINTSEWQNGIYFLRRDEQCIKLIKQ